MLYDIALTLGYDYPAPQGSARHVLRLLPRALPGLQRVVAARLEVDPAPEFRTGWTDFFGAEAVTVGHAEPHRRMAFTVTARVERLAAPAVLDIAPALPRLAAELDTTRRLDPDSPHHFRGRSPRVRPERAMTEYARAQLSDGMTALEAVRAVGEALHRDMTFDPEVTDVDTAPGDAFARRHGVCQDFSHVMIACLRGIGLPAGYVSGLIRTLPPPGRPRLEGADAMHAWVRAWCGVEVGWVEYDPTNAMWAGTDHVLIAYGRDYSDVSPVRGVLRGSGTPTPRQSVDMVAAPPA